MVSIPFRQSLFYLPWRKPVLGFLDRLVDASQFRREHVLLYAPVFLGIGIALYLSLLSEPSPRWVFNSWIGVLACLLYAHHLYSQYHSHTYNILRMMALFLCLMVSGFFLAQVRTLQVSSPLLAKDLKFADVVGEVKEVDILPGRQGQKLTLTNVRIEELPAEKTPKNIRIRVRGDQVYAPGQSVKALASLHAPSAPVSPGAFDFQRHNYFQQLGAIGFSYHPPEILEEKKRSGFSEFWENLRLSVAMQIRKALPEEQQGVMVTFMTGEKSTIPETDLQAMRDSGLAHLLAISGLHVGLVAGFVFFFVRLGLAAIPDFALKYPIKKWAAGTALIFAFFYMFLVGASIPTQRAMMMTGIALFAIMVDRSPFSLHMVALAALVILCAYPESLMTPSFQMSFAAVTALVAFYDAFRPQMQLLYREAGIFRKGMLYILGIAVTTVIAGAATSVYGVYHFQAWSLYSTLANIMAMPVMALLVMPLAVLSYLLMPFGLAYLPLSLMGQGVDWVLSVAHYVSGLEGAVIRFMAFPDIYLGAMTLALVLIAIGPRLLRWGGLTGLIGTFILLSFQPVTNRLLISEDVGLIGYYEAGSHQFYVSSLRRERFIRENWLNRLGLEEESGEKLADHPAIQCGGEGCRMQFPQVKVAWPQTDYALREDCLWADVIIAETFVPRGCHAEYIMDRRFTRKNGAVEISLTEGGVADIQTVRALRGVRPWTNKY